LIKLSIVIITYNEERNIGRCLESVKAIADDITVVDSLSTDKTRTICESYGVHFVEHAFEGHIRQKNFAASQAKYPHQLSLDADEALSEELQNSIQLAKENWDTDGYRMNRRSNYCGQWINHSGWYPDTKIRLYDIRKGRWGGMDPHDKIEMEAGAKVDFLKGDILHYTYYTINEHVSQANKFSSIAAWEMYERGQKINLFQVFTHSVAKFLKHYFVFLGILDGKAGFTIAYISAIAAYRKYITQIQLKKKNTPVRKRIILSRTDSIGDVVLTLPMAGVLKAHNPKVEILFLGSSYTRDVVALSKYVDVFLDWDNIKKWAYEEQLSFFKRQNAQTIIHIFPKKAIAKLASKARIPMRIGTTGRFYHYLFCNKLIPLSRRNSPLHESQLNMMLLKPILHPLPLLPLQAISIYYGFKVLVPITKETQQLLSADKFNLIIHPKSKGSAREWPLTHFTDLIQMLPTDTFNIFITGTADEGKLMEGFLIENQNRITDLTGALSLNQLIAFIDAADGMLAVSTGPLHIAAALKKFAVGIYPPIRPMHPGRWSPIGINAHYIVADKVCSDCRNNNLCHCMNEINPTQVLEILLKLNKK